MFKKLLGNLVAALALAVLSPAQTAETIHLAVTDISGMKGLQREFGPFKAALEEVTGLKVDFFGVNSRTAAVEAMRAKQVDFVLTGPAEYVVFRSRTDRTTSHRSSPWLMARSIGSRPEGQEGLLGVDWFNVPASLPGAGTRRHGTDLQHRLQPADHQS